MHESAHQVGVHGPADSEAALPLPAFPALYKYRCSTDVYMMWFIFFLFQTTAPALCFLPAWARAHTDMVFLGLLS